MDAIAAPSVADRDDPMHTVIFMPGVPARQPS